jgi:triphosphatase
MPRATAGNEVEVKLQVPHEAVAALQRDLARGRCVTTRLAATYFDTPDRRLACAGLVLRLRRESAGWVQALKAPGDGLLERLEHEVACGAARAMPALDLARHDTHQAGRALRAALDGRAPEPLFTVDVRRHQREVRLGAARIELAFDQGSVRAGAARAPVCELELELRAGPVDALGALALRWAERHGLWLDTRSKSERGYLLAAGEAARPATGYAPPRLTKKDRPEAALRAALRSALAQWLPNAGALAAGAGGPAHVHQARVGLRRVLTLLRVFGTWSGEIDGAWADRAGFVFDQLGGTRDRDVLEASLLPALRAAGAPTIELTDAMAPPDPQAACRSADATRCAIELLAFAHGAAAESTETLPLATAAADPLRRLHRQARRAGRDFATLADDERHRARRRIKRLRYAAEAVSSLFPRAAWAAYLDRLKAAQDALGAFQDLCVAQALFAEPAASDAGAWFARGYLAAQREPLIARAGEALRAIGKPPSFMR